MNSKTTALYAMISLGTIATANAATLLDTGSPAIDAPYPLALDGADFYATKFTIGGSYTIDSIYGFITAGGSGIEGDTLTIALYSDNNSHVGTQLQSTQATFSADGWNGVTSLNWSAGPGNYWVAFEVGASDSTSGLQLPLLSMQNPTVLTAFSAGSNYANASGMEFGVRVTGTPAVPVPAAAWLFASGLGCIGGIAKRSRRK